MKWQIIKNETTDNENNSVDWSEEALLSESRTETGTALKVAAQPVTQMKTQEEKPLRTQ